MDATDTVCKSCGHAMRKLNRNWSKFTKISVITLIIAAFGAYIALYNLEIINLDFFANIFRATEVSEDAPVTDVDYIMQAPMGETNDGGDIVPVRRDEEEKIAALSAVLAAADTYIRNLSTFNPIISSAGFLHNAASGEYITAELLVNQGNLDEEYLIEDLFILHLRPVDLDLFYEVSFDDMSASQMGFLTVFLGYELPSGIGLFSRFGAQMIFRENLNQLLLNHYSSNNGEITRPTTQDDVYHAVIGMLSGANPEGDVFIRYLAVDDVHGFVAFSMSVDAHNIRNYVFELEYDNYQLAGLRILATGFETTQHPKVAINGAVPNFNLMLMPEYDIANIGLLDGSSSVFLDILATMEQNGQIEEDGEPTFVSATADFAYIVHTSGNVFFGQYGGHGWSIVPVDDWQTAEALMVDNVNNPPLYIIWQQ